MNRLPCFHGPIVSACAPMFVGACIVGMCGFAVLAISTGHASATNIKPAAMVTRPRIAASPRLLSAYNQLPMGFEPNQGQSNPQTKFLSRGYGYSVFLTSKGALLSLAAPDNTTAGRQLSPARPAFAKLRRPTRHSTVYIAFNHSNRNPRITGECQLPGQSSYYLGKNRSNWRVGIPTYARVRYHNIYPGIDAVYYGDQGRLEYDFVLSPGADPKRIELDFQDAQQLNVDARGDLVVEISGGGSVIEHRPVVYQEIDGVRRQVSGSFALKEKHRVGLVLAAYDHSRPVIIDPALTYATYLGGTRYDQGTAIAVDSSGNAYVTGFTESTNFPSTPGAYQSSLKGFSNIFVSKLNSSGTALLYSTYLGGSNYDEARSIAIDAAGNAYITGDTNSSDFPTTPGAFQTSGSFGPIVSKLNSSGTLVYSTYLGNGRGYGIAVDSQGDAYIAGQAFANFPTTYGAFQTTINGVGNAFVAKLNPTGSALLYSTYLGGGCCDSAYAIAIDSSGNAYVTGQTGSTDFPITPGAFETVFSGLGADIFISKLSSDGSTLLYSTYLGGTTFQSALGIAVDSQGSAYVTGYTNSIDFPTTPGALQSSYPAVATLGQPNEAFVTKINVTGSALAYSTYLGGDHGSAGFGISVDSTGNAYVAGSTDSDDFPTTLDAFQSAAGGNGNAFVSKFNSNGSGLVYSTLFAPEFALAVAVDSAQGIYITGRSYGSLPVTVGAPQAFSNGIADAYVAKFGTTSGIPMTLFFESLKLTLSANQFQLNGSFFQYPINTDFDPTKDPVTLEVGTYSVTIPPGSFVQNKHGQFVFQGSINKSQIQFTISQSGGVGSIYTLQVQAGGTGLKNVSAPVLVILIVGNDGGGMTVTPG